MSTLEETERSQYTIMVFIMDVTTHLKMLMEAKVDTCM